MQTRKENGLVTWANDRVVLVPSFDDSLCLSIITTTTMNMTTKKGEEEEEERERQTRISLWKNSHSFLFVRTASVKSEKEKL